ncbi:cation-translocating P-type ATPase [Streptomyces sp. NPDC059002]|uniref:cation-translocating P-type ATPase n=1 Tax=Streptomyces sp. NPDC059002 TaxID=3346690 RepID=UPI0036B7CAC7
MDERVEAHGEGRGGTAPAAPAAPAVSVAPAPPAGPVPAGSLRTAHGLTAEQVAERIAQGRVNDVPARPGRTVAGIVRAHLLTRINAVIGALFVIAAIVGPVQDALFGGVILANTLIGVVLELRARRTLDRLAVVGDTTVRVRRDGSPVTLGAAEIVVDDTVDVVRGDRIVADGLVRFAEGLEVDESLLTGEADPVVKRRGDTVLSGSFVVAGTGTFTATRVGHEAYAARLTVGAHAFGPVDSELRSGIDRILRCVTLAVVPAGIALLVTQLMVGEDLPEAVRRMVGGLVPMVPDGLVLLTSLAFAVGVVRLGRKRCLVQELPAVEGLARVDTVCLDKTGTLTEPSMDVDEVHSLDPAVPVDAVLGALGGADAHPDANMRAVIASRPVPAEWVRTANAPFSSARRWSGATFIEACGVDSTWLIGAPDVLLRPGHTVLAAADTYGARGLRVLLLVRCSRPLADLLRDPSAVPDAVVPCALVTIRQRVREEVPGALRYFAEQGVTTKVLSGDSAVSVGAVATALDLPGAHHPVDARYLPEAPAELADAVGRGTVFGRVGPRQKRDMVKALQAKGHTVAMTGDGVNDVLAVGDADIGVALGSGSPATRSAARIVLLDNSFAALPPVVAEGRRIIGNIERVAHLFLTKTVYSVLLAIAVVCARAPYPFLPRHITLVGTLTIGVPAFFLALAPGKERARPDFVGRVLRFAVPAGTLAAVATSVAYLAARRMYDGDLDAQTSAATLALFLVALWALAIIARPYTWWRILLVLTMAAGFVLVLVVPRLQEFFQLRLVGAAAPWTSVGCAAVAGLALELVWAYGRRTRAAVRTL